MTWWRYRGTALAAGGCGTPTSAGSIATASSPEELRKRYEDRIAIFGRIARDAGIKPQ